MAKFVFIPIGKILVNQMYASQSNCQVKIVVLVVHDYIMIMSGLSIRPRYLSVHFTTPRQTTRQTLVRGRFIIA